MSSGLEIVYQARLDTDPNTPMNTDIHYEYRRHLHGFLPLIAKISVKTSHSLVGRQRI
jgi:hypothetical protein